MIAFICILYASLYFVLFNKLQLLKKTAANLSAFVGVGVVIISSIVFAWYTFSPVTADVRVARYVLPIVSHVKGRVVELNVGHLQQVKKGDVLFRLDPRPFQDTVNQLKGQVKQLEAQRDLQVINVERVKTLVAKNAASQIQLDTELAKLKAADGGLEATNASLDNAEWQLE